MVSSRNSRFATRKDFPPLTFLTRSSRGGSSSKTASTAMRHVKAELDIYARSTGRPIHLPFMLKVVADRHHPRRSLDARIIEARSSFGGRYKGRVIRIDSATKGEESEDATARLLALETDTTTDVVIHVNKLKETGRSQPLHHCPVAASASDILTEQTLGRGAAPCLTARERALMQSIP